MEREEFRGAYLGFTYNDIHSSTFGIVRTSDGSRYNQNLLPTMQDKSLSIPGMAGKVLQSSEFDTRVFSVQIAYDALTEEQMQEMKIWLGDKKIHPLIFDETPYKTWYAKVTGTASMKWLPFTETLTNRVYKGEGTIQFTCYDPFAHCSADFDWTNYPDFEEWIDSSRLEQRDYALGAKAYNHELDYVQNDPDATYVCGIAVYNCGDTPADFVLSILSGYEYENNQSSLEIWLTEYPEYDASRLGELKFDSINARYCQLRLSSKLNLIERYTRSSSDRPWKKELSLPITGSTSGAYFKIPTGKTYYLWARFTGKGKNDESGFSTYKDRQLPMTIDYEYLYL